MFNLTLKKIILFIGLNILLSSFLILVANIFPVDTTEQGVLEVTQLVILGACFALGSIGLFFLRSVRYSHRDAIMSWMLWVITVIIFGRETSWGSEYAIHDTISDQIELISIALLGVLVLSLAVNWWIQEKDKWQFILDILRLPIVPIFYAAASFVVMGDFFEKEYLNFNHNQLFEEGYEGFGYALFLWGYYLHVRGIMTNSVAKLN